MSQAASPSSSILTHRPDVPIVPVPLLHYASGTVYHPPLQQAQISAYVGVQLVPPTTYSNQASARITLLSIGGKKHPNESMTLLPVVLRVPAKIESRLRRREAKRAVGFLPRYGSYSMDGMSV